MLKLSRWRLLAVFGAVQFAGVMLLSIGLYGASAAAGTVVTVGSAATTPGGTVNIPVTIVLDAEDAAFNGFDVDLTFDPSVATVTNVALGPDYPEFIPPTIDNSAGTLNVVGFEIGQNPSCAPTCTLFTVTFSAVGAGVTSLGLSGTLTDAGLPVIPGDIVPGTISVATASVTNTPTYTNTPTTPTDTTTATATSTGTITATATSTGTVTATATPTMTPDPGTWHSYVPMIAADGAP